MAKGDTIKIDTVPFPERELSVKIPTKLLEEFQKDIRVVVRHPWVIGIPVPFEMLRPDLANRLKGTGLEVMLVPQKESY